MDEIQAFDVELCCPKCGREGVAQGRQFFRDRQSDLIRISQLPPGLAVLKSGKSLPETVIHCICGEEFNA